MCGDRGGVRDIGDKKHCVFSFCCYRLGASKPVKKLEIGEPVGTVDFNSVGCGPLWSAPTAGKPVGNDSSEIGRTGLVFRRLKSVWLVRLGVQTRLLKA
jgi:hypothetical protein